MDNCELRVITCINGQLYATSIWLGAGICHGLEHCLVIASQVHHIFMLDLLCAVHVQADGTRPMRGVRLHMFCYALASQRALC